MHFTTAAQIAKHFNVSRDRVSYVLASQRIEPVARAGLVRLYRPDTIERVRDALAAQDQRRMKLRPVS